LLCACFVDVFINTTLPLLECAFICYLYKDYNNNKKQKTKATKLLSTVAIFGFSCSARFYQLHQRVCLDVSRKWKPAPNVGPRAPKGRA
jgi:hypothetical protein